MKTSFLDIKKDILDNNIAPVVVISGKENYLIDWAVKTIAKQYIKDNLTSLNLVKFKESDDNLDDIISSALTEPFFSNKRVVVSYNNNIFVKKNVAEKSCDIYTEKLEKFLKNTKNTMLIFILDKETGEKGMNKLGKRLAKIGSYYELSKLNENDLGKFINSHFKREGKDISKANIYYMIDKIGYFNKESSYNLNILENDIKKIIMYNQDRLITKDAIDTIVIGDRDTYVFKFMDKLLTGNKAVAYNMFFDITNKGEEYFRSLKSNIVKQFEMMLDIAELSKEGISLKEQAKLLGANEYRLTKAAATLRQFDIKKIIALLEILYSIEKKERQGNIDGKTEFIRFMSMI